MKKFGVFLAAAALGALPLTAAAFGGHMSGGRLGMAMGQPGMMGPHAFNRSAFGHGFRGAGRPEGFAFRHDGHFEGRAFARDGRFFRHHREFFFRHHHRRFFRSNVVLVGVGFPYYPYYPYYYPYPYDGYPYDYYPYSGAAYGSAEPYPRDQVVAVQTELARLGYYRGPIDGRLGLGTRRASRAFQAANGLPVTGYIDPKFLRTLGRG